jgi:hypothetical protein
MAGCIQRPSSTGMRVNFSFGAASQPLCRRGASTIRGSAPRRRSNMRFAFCTRPHDRSWTRPMWWRQGRHEMCQRTGPDDPAGTRFTGRWMEMLSPRYGRVVALPACGAQRTAPARQAVPVSPGKPLTCPSLRAAVQAGALVLHGLWISMGEDVAEPYVVPDQGACVPLSEGGPRRAGSTARRNAASTLSGSWLAARASRPKRTSAISR